MAHPTCPTRPATCPTRSADPRSPRAARRPAATALNCGNAAAAPQSTRPTPLDHPAAHLLTVPARKVPLTCGNAEVGGVGIHRGPAAPPDRVRGLAFSCTKLAQNFRGAVLAVRRALPRAA
jgi:hypothetical protein